MYILYEMKLNLLLCGLTFATASEIVGFQRVHIKQNKENIRAFYKAFYGSRSNHSSEPRIAWYRLTRTRQNRGWRTCLCLRLYDTRIWRPLI